MGDLLPEARNSGNAPPLATVARARSVRGTYMPACFAAIAPMTGAR